MTIDPDMHPCVPEIPSIRSMLTGETLAVHGVRRTRPDAGIARRLASAAINFLVRRLTGITVKDIGCPITMFHRDTEKKLNQEINPEINPKIHIYMALGPSLKSYELKKGSVKVKQSHYSLLRLVITAAKLIKDCLYLRRRQCKA